jgi:TM2 domain-containing membrane protein YozV
MKYHYANEANDAVGPVEESELHELFNKGEIKRDTNILPEGADAWHPYSRLTGVPAPPTNNSTLTPSLAATPPQHQHVVAEAMQRCPYCSEQVFASAKKCKHCGETLDVALRAAEEAKKSSSSQQQPMVFMNAGGGGGGSSSAAAAASGGLGQMVGTKSRVVAAMLAFFLGWIGVHKFYLGQIGWGIIYVLLSWTFIPFFVSLIEGVLYLLSTERAFALKYG